MKIISTGLSTLDAMLGGGLVAFPRDRSGMGANSASLLVRGDTGTGKTFLAMQIANAISRGPKIDTLYIGTETLPTEIGAHLDSRKDGVSYQKVYYSPFGKEARESQDSPCLYAAILEFTHTREDIWRGMRGFFFDVLERRPCAVMLDAVPETLGVDRKFVEDLRDWAATEGFMLLVIEETSTYQTSEWCLSFDTVIELRMQLSEEIYRRFLSIRKHRSAPSVPGPHGFTLEREGLLFVGKAEP